MRSETFWKRCDMFPKTLARVSVTPFSQPIRWYEKGPHHISEAHQRLCQSLRRHDHTAQPFRLHHAKANAHDHSHKRAIACEHGRRIRACRGGCGNGVTPTLARVFGNMSHRFQKVSERIRCQNQTHQRPNRHDTGYPSPPPCVLLPWF